MAIFMIQVVIAEYDKRVITTLKYSKFSITPTIVNGQPALEGQFPYLVSFKEPTQRIEPGKSMWKNLCGGSIIDKRRVLTAAHCFEVNHFFYVKFPGILRVVAGDIRNDIIHSGDTETTEIAQWRQLIQATIHDNFNFPSDDIAIAVVNKPWVFNEYVNSINIARRSTDYPRTCISAGYGRVGHRLRDNIAPVLLSAEIVVMPKWRCSMLWEIDMKNFICTDSALSDVARGDSGGPLICSRTGDPNEKNGGGLLVGVVSGKNYDKTTLYTRVSSYHDWITDAGATKCRSHVFLTIILFVVIYLLFHYSL